jgi:hypothetical protein
VFIEEFDELCKVGKRPCQPVDLVDDDDIDLPRPDFVQKSCRAGRSNEAPESPPSSNLSGTRVQPSCAWLLI